MTQRWRFCWRSPDEAGGGGAGGTGNGQTQEPTGGTPLDFDGWYGSLGDDQRALIEGHVQGLKSGLEAERKARSEMERQLRDLAKKADAGSEAQERLTRMADELESERRRAAFAEGAPGAGIRNVAAAYKLAVADSLFGERGEPDYAALRERYPELFATPQPRTGGDGGDGGNGPVPRDMNAIIRRAAGRR